MLVLVGILIFLLSTLWYFSNDLPDYKILANYKPPISSRVHSGGGQLIAEYALQKRLFIPYESIPKKVINSFLSAEDKNFFSHPGIDVKSITRAFIRNIQNTLSSKRTQPSFDTSSMDGYAISKKNIKKFPLRLKVKDEIKAGDIPKFSLKPGYAIRVFTGSFLPKGTERIVLQEYCKKDNNKQKYW